MQYGKIARGRGRETNIAQGEAECYIRLETMPECCDGSGNGSINGTARLHLEATEVMVTNGIQHASMVIEVNGSAKKVTLSVTCPIWQACCICPNVLYFTGNLGKYSTLGQIQHTCTFEVYNMEIKVHFSL